MTIDMYVADSNNNIIRMLDISGSTATTGSYIGTQGSAGNVDGAAATSKFNIPYGIVFDGTKDNLCILSHRRIMEFFGISLDLRYVCQANQPDALHACCGRIIKSLKGYVIRVLPNSEVDNNPGTLKHPKKPHIFRAVLYCFD